jgi:hypothetical protein
MSFVAISGLLLGAMAVPAAAQAPDQDQIVVAAPAGPSWDETSGYASVEASRALAAAPATLSNQVPADVRWAPAVSWDEASGYGAVEHNRVTAE